MRHKSRTFRVHYIDLRPKNVNIVAGENGTVEKTADGIVMTAAGGSSGVGIDVRSILPENAEAGSYKSVEVSYKITFADGADTSLFTGGKIALVQDETNLIGTYDDGTNLAYGFPATAFEGSQSLALTNATGKIVGINIQLWNQADWTWPTGLTLTITGIKFAAKPAGTKPAYEKKDFEYEGLNEGAMKAHFESLDPTKTTVAFTFDDGPIGTKEGTAGMVVQEALLAHKATATFNYIGSLYKNNADAKKEILLAKERGFEVANHSMDFNSVTADTVDLIQENRALLKELTGYSNFTFRAPNLSYGYGLNYTDAPVIGVSVDSQDWNKATEDQIYTNVTKNLKDGDIVLMHLNQPTYKVIDKILQFCDDNNIQVCSASELAKLRGVTMKTNTRYDRITAAK